MGVCYIYAKNHSSLNKFKDLQKKKMNLNLLYII